jgi:DHA2 family multidrug resistance protein
MSNFNLQGDFFSIALPRFVQGIGLGMFFVPLSTAAFVNIRMEKMGNATGIFSLVRNLGGSFGVAFATTVLSQRTQVHQTFLSEHITPYNHVFQQAFQRTHNFLQMNLSGSPTSPGTLAFIYGEVLRQASILAFNDTFYILAGTTAILIPLTLLLRKGRAGADSPGAGMH